MTRATIKWFNAPKGFGFAVANGSADIFIHHSIIEMEGYRQLFEGQVVELDYETGTDGRLKATKVVPL